MMQTVYSLSLWERVGVRGYVSLPNPYIPHPRPLSRRARGVTEVAR
jgi:hypothetical protein